MFAQAFSRRTQNVGVQRETGDAAQFVGDCAGYFAHPGAVQLLLLRKVFVTRSAKAFAPADVSSDRPLNVIALASGRRLAVGRIHRVRRVPSATLSSIASSRRHSRYSGTQACLNGVNATGEASTPSRSEADHQPPGVRPGTLGVQM